MKTLAFLLGSCLLGLTGCSSTTIIFSPHLPDPGDLSQIAAAAARNHPDAIATLRNEGQAGLDALLAVDPALIKGMRDGSIPLDDTTAMALRTAIDAVAKQRDAHASGLYWFTD